MKKIISILLLFISTVSFSQKSLDSLFRAKDKDAKGLSTNDLSNTYKGILDYTSTQVFYSQYGTTEYTGNTTYSQPALGIIKKIENNISFNTVEIAAYAGSSTAGYVSIYKASNMPNYSTSGTFMLPALTFLERVYLGSGEWNTSSTKNTIINTNAILSLQKDEFLYIVCQVVSGTNVILKIFNTNNTNTDRLPIIFALTSPTLLTTPYYYGTSAYLSTSPILSISVKPFRLTTKGVNIPKNIYITTGRELNIWKNQLVLDGENINNKVDFFASVGTNKERAYRLNTTTLGNNSLNVVVNDNSYSTTVSVVAKNAGIGSKNVLVIGDSFVAQNTIVQTIKDNNTADGGMTFTMIGTQGTSPYKHEGRGGWTYAQYITTGSPFYISGSLNFTQYCINNSISGIDIAAIVLGTNDVFATSMTESQLATIIVNSKTLIARLLADYPSVKIVVAMPTLGGTQDGFGANYGAGVSIEQFKVNMNKLHRLLLDAYDNNVYSTSVRIAPSYLFVDKLYGFQRTTVAASARESTTVTESNNGVHPSTSGYQQFADSIYSTILSFY